MTIDVAIADSIGDSELVTVSSTPIGLTASKITVNAIHAKTATVQVQGASIWFTVDPAQTPAQDNGFLLRSDDILELETPSDVRNFRAIRDATTDATLYVEYAR